MTIAFTTRASHIHGLFNFDPLDSPYSQSRFRAEQSRAEQSRAEQSRAEQSRAEQSRAEQSRSLRRHRKQRRVGRIENRWKDLAI
jgi:hypothetical protein